MTHVFGMIIPNDSYFQRASKHETVGCTSTKLLLTFIAQRTYEVKDLQVIQSELSCLQSSILLKHSKLAEHFTNPFSVAHLSTSPHSIPFFFIDDVLAIDYRGLLRLAPPAVYTSVHMA
jgi:hypothetical protein